ncbi:MAG: phosphopyruvate hydratase [Candidatus Magasanikbacteria bacterium CG11_big_fil_rev_8_21_14_0_20_43_7]|uniref:Enolase n=1 Tax=Candidatus Magasanikbacteria bacterium CG11_big_fil_rev_8_21_14_0_20_43_7 TaxID=1974654 RepID=A0A2H0N276_9BACT|nr:MAG: phosphopyruvate hydratase [Candidatus Magasanikbacteria bacterium CG11_big_fil_rev_8_21_14_0_20_43_7]
MKKTAIQSITAREILDSRGNPTIEATVTLADRSVGVATVPSGASTGTHEALELRDGAKRYGGKGVLKAVKHVNTILARELHGFDATRQRILDETMIALDGTVKKKTLGANAILSVSLATCRAVAVSKKMPLYKYIRTAFRLPEKKWIMPLATMNVINGGRHASNGLSIQEFMIVPKHKQFKERVRIGSQIFHTLGQLLAEKKFSTGVGDEGGYAPEFTDNEQALKFLMKAIQKAGFEPGRQVMLAMDVAASEFYKSGKYYFLGQHVGWTADKMIRTLDGWLRKYPFVSIEDPLSEDDWDNWKLLTKRLGKKTDIVGDDIFVTNNDRIKKGIDMRVGNAVLIKLNQIGTLSETIDAVYLARKHGYAVSVSHRSGETADTFIADLAVAVNSEYIKTGSMSRSERVEKYNRLMQIEEELGLV